MAEETISVIVPVYNVEPYLRRCVDSILAQTYRNLEVLLVDDGSTDHSGAICDEYARQDARVVVIHQKNQGQAIARNRAIEIAHGKYFAFADADDFMDRRMLEIMLQDMLTVDAEVSVVGFQAFQNEEQLKFVDAKEPVQILSKEDAIRSILLTEQIGDFLWNKLYKRELFCAIRFPEGRVMEDLGTTYRLLECCEKIAYRPSPLYFYYQREDSTLHLRKRRFYEDKLDMGLMRYYDLKEKNICCLENDAAMLNNVEHCYPYLFLDPMRKAQMEQFLNGFEPKALKLMNRSSQRKYKLLKLNRSLYTKLFLLKNGPAAEEQ